MFKDIDAWKDSEDKIDQDNYAQYKELEDKYPKLFEYARKFEGNARNLGVHASGILVTPMPINDYVPMRYVDGTAVTLYEGPTLESSNFVKFDILGLRNLDVIDLSMQLINPKYNYYNVYNIVNSMADSDTYSLIRDKKTDGLFQLESDLFKHTIGDMQPDNINDIGALNAICRPGPLQAHLDEQYNDTKNGKKELIEPLPKTLDIVQDTYGAIIYQEQVMAISVKVCGFNANQSDSIVRKIIGKKKKDKLAMLRRMMIYGKINQEGPEGWHDNNSMPWYDPKRQYGDEIDGALKRGYTYEQMDNFFNLLMGFAEYCFNKSHAMCYAYLGYITAFLKTHYPIQFMTALLSMQDDQDKIYKYVNIARDMDIEVKAPDINISNRLFTIKDNTIYFGIGAIKGIGNAAIPEILNHKPYNSFMEFYNKTDHRLVKKNVLSNLILAGCFDFEQTNRHKLIGNLARIKALPDTDPLTIMSKQPYTKINCMQYETEYLGLNLTYRSTFENIAIGDKATLYGSIDKLTERSDKNGKMMAFVDFNSENTVIRCLIFSSTYSKCRGTISQYNTNNIYSVSGRKSDQNTFIINSISLEKESYEQEFQLG